MSTCQPEYFLQTQWFCTLLLQSPDNGFTDHIVLCVLAEDDSPKLGLLNFIMPLRGSNFRKSELKDIVIVSSQGYMEKEWPVLENFPRIWFFPVSVISI